ncbi:PilZ domain-containing protein [Sphingomonas morindae]|uniref:PilZ domain-containing protein n=1 Tax=Sphingomonas morindae TaxID=1541170 RepID=A0ABY4XDD4_9SPHN|nr:PilZ domain-containing protein [Sphingomonas morindae]USI74940.1 PilZ domain-containing protein [Sphingomonas morindae]
MNQVAYQEPTGIPTAELVIERRGAERAPVQVSASVETGDGIAFAASLRNLSPSGFRARCPIMLKRGDRVFVRLAGTRRRRPAKVMWTEAQEIGCRFAVPLTPALLLAQSA